jgi:hypothetical protein
MKENYGEKWIGTELIPTLEKVIDTKIIEIIEMGDEWKTANSMLDFPLEGKMTVKTEKGRVRLAWLNEVEIKFSDGKRQLNCKIEGIAALFENGDAKEWVQYGFANILGITQARLNEIEQTIISAYEKMDTKTDTLQKILSAINGENERRAVELLLISYAEDEMMRKSAIDHAPAVLAVFGPQIVEQLKKCDCAKKDEGVIGYQ